MKNFFIVVLRKNITRDIIEDIDFDNDETIEIEMSKNHILVSSLPRKIDDEVNIPLTILTHAM
jgi:hypothetical protein